LNFYLHRNERARNYNKRDRVLSKQENRNLEYPSVRFTSLPTIAQLWFGR